MPRLEGGSVDAARIDAALREWRQGDVALGAREFFHVQDSRMSASEAVVISNHAEGKATLAVSDVSGLVVVTQTCDVVRGSVERPYVELSPIVATDETRFREVERRMRPRFAFIAALAEQRLVADLDRTMTVEKPLLVSWTRTPGWTSDADGRRFASDLARKRARPVFPDDFSALVRGLQDRAQEKHDRRTPEGNALRALQEIRVDADPDWNAPQVSLMFWFVRTENGADGIEWASYVSK